MDLRKLKTLIDLVSESGISELEITEGEGKVRIVKNPAPVAAAPVQMMAPAPAPLPAAAPAAAPVAAEPTGSAGAVGAHREVADGRHLLSLPRSRAPSPSSRSAPP